MGHLKIYEKLQEKLDKAPVGFPESPEGEEKEILRILFSEEEADLAQDLPFVSFTIEDVSKRMDKSEEKIENTLDEMSEKGTVLKDEREEGTVYRLLPVVVGWMEIPFASGPEEDSRQEELAPLWKKYWINVWLDELGDRDTSVMRALPEKDSISSETQILPYEDAVKLVKAREDIAAVHCACRVKTRLTGSGCEHSLENCLTFGPLARAAVKQGFGEKISSEEALKILKEANQEGLVHTIENHQGKLEILCNCCECCCMLFQSIHKADNPDTIAKSSYQAEVDTEECIACGICALRCPMNAITVKKNKEPAEIDNEKCIGCGVCHPTCPTDAIQLELREDAEEPPEYVEYVKSLLEDRGKDMSDLQ